MEEPQRPLEGLLVLDLGHIYQAPYCGFLMAMAGATVIKIEPPNGEPLRRRAMVAGGSVPQAMLNSNKLGLSLDLKNPQGQDIFLRLVDQFLPHLHLGADLSHAEGIPTSWQRSVLLVLAITLHNIPEGLAVGVAFGAVAHGLPSATMAGAIALALGIGIQNFPEGAAVSLPLRREGMSATRAFMLGQASGMVEPIAGVIGAAAVLYAQPILPYALAFAAGAMIFVVVKEVIPESQAGGHGDWATMGVMTGFTVMMILDVGLG